MIVAMKIEKVAFVTGGSGFIGSCLIRALQTQGIRVRALMRKTSSDKNLQGLEFEKIIGDLQNLDALREGMTGVDYVFHLAGMVFAKNRDEYFIHNCEGTKNVGSICAEVNPKVKRFVFVSSLAASGPCQDLTPKSETDFDKPVSWYGESKLAAERELLKIADGIFPVSVVRPPAVYGPKDQDMFTFFKSVNKGIAPLLPNNNSTKNKYYSLVHVDDLIDGIIKAGIVEDTSRRDTYYLCSDQVQSMREIYEEISNAMVKKPKYIQVPTFVLKILASVFGFVQSISKKRVPLNKDKLNELIPDFWICSNQHAKQKLGFKPKYNLTKGIEQTTKWYQKEGWL